MTKFTAILLLGLTSLLAAPAEQPPSPADLSIYHGCPMDGDAHSAAVQALNRFKNRYTAPMPTQINPNVTLAAILAPGYDIGRWKVKDGATITGYVYEVKPGGVETVNCHARDWADRDTYIELVFDPMRFEAPQRMIVEVRLRWRAIMVQQGMD